MARSSLLLMSLCTATPLLAQDSAPNEEIAMLKQSTCESPVPNNPIGNKTDPVAILEKQMQELITDTALGDFGAQAASARPQLCSNRLYIKADGFLWKAFVGGSDYAATDSMSGGTVLIGETKRADFRWRWGFRTELGYRLPHDNWDALTNYSWFQDKSDRSAASPSGGVIIPLIPAFSSTAYHDAHIRWHLLYQNFDLDLRKAYFLNRHFSVSPFFGLRNTWLNQSYHASYANLDATQTIDVLTKQDFWGIGPLAGLNSEWHITNQWWVFGSFIGAVLAADYDICSRVLHNETLENKIKADTKRLSPTVQGAMGFGWHMNLNRQRNHIAVRLCYEAQYWWKQNLTLDYSSGYYVVARLGEDLGFHGFTLDVLFDF
jgi:hypothetical protein